MKQKTLLLFVLLAINAFLPLSLAYIPTYPMILSQLASSQGRGSYLIEQEVFLEGINPITLKETWWIKGSGKMRLDVRAKKKEWKELYLRFIYDGKKKVFRDTNNQIQKVVISPYHLDRPFHLRDKEKLQNLFSSWKVTPAYIPNRKEGDGSDPFIKLSRKGGVISYQIGLGKAKLWIEQDEFVMRTWKWANNNSLHAWDYKLYPGSLFFPSSRFFKQESTEIKITVRSVKKTKMDKSSLQISVLSKKNKLPDKMPTTYQDILRDFYKNFR